MDNGTDSFEEIAMPHLNTVYRAAVAMCGERSDAARSLVMVGILCTAITIFFLRLFIG